MTEKERRAAVPTGPSLVVEGVSVSLGGRKVLDEVSFAVGQGELTGLIGANGAGKTTLLRVVLGLLRPSAGRVHLPGAPPGNAATGAAPARGRRGPGRSVGYVPQKVVLDPDLPLRARDLVELGLDGHRLGARVRARDRRLAVEGMLEAVGAVELADARAGRLSGGELQRVLIAHALVSHPRLLLLDEPLANLDPRSTAEIVALLHRICGEHRVSVLLTAHEVNPLVPYMDRVVYLAGGKAAAGTTDEVIRGDVLSRLYGHHVDVVHVHGRILVVVGPEPPAPTAHEPVLEVG